MTPYNERNHSPPAPVASISLRTFDGESGFVPKVSALIDTGAEITLLPRWAVEQLGTLPTFNASTKIAWFDGSERSIDCVEVSVTFLEGSFRGRFLVADQPQGIIGRDLLNHFTLVFDGPAKSWHRI